MALEAASPTIAPPSPLAMPTLASLAPSLLGVKAESFYRRALALFQPSLPKYSGPFDVGVHDIEVQSPADPNRTVLARLYYPASGEGGVRAYWLPHHIYAYGYGDFLGLPKWLSYAILYPLVAFIRKPALIDAPLSPNVTELPIVLFSHGLGGNRTTYSHFCGDLASWGKVVVSMEHSDGSANITGRNNHSVLIRYKRLTAGVDLWQFRNNQLKYRLREVGDLLDVLKGINAGESLKNQLGVSKPAAKFDIQDFKGKLNLNKLIMAGHSFGAATVLAVLDSSSPFHDRFIAGVALDPWMLPLEPLSIPSTPLLLVNSDTFHWPENVVSMRKLLAKNARNDYLTILNTAHQNQSDLPILFPKILRRRKMGGKMDPQRAILLNNAAVLSFLGQLLNEPDAQKIWDMVSASKDILVGLEPIEKRFLVIADS